MSTQTAIDRLVRAYDTGRLRRDLIDLLEEEPFTRFAEWADSLQEIATAVDEAREALETWAEEEEREFKADAKDRALDALETLVSVWNGSPLDVSALCDYDPDEADADLGAA